MNYETENFFDKEVTFTYDGIDYLWIGDYSVDESIEEESEFAPAYSEIEVRITHTSSLASYEHGFDIAPTASMLTAVELEIEKNY